MIRVATLSLALIAAFPAHAVTPKIAAGQDDGLALKADGTVWGWGSGTYGELGTGSSKDATLPVQASALTGVVAVRAFEHRSAALRADGTVWMWGHNRLDYLGVGNDGPCLAFAVQNCTATPRQVAGLSDVIDVVLGGSQTLALKADGSVWRWGEAVNGAQSNAAGTSTAVPTQVSGLPASSAVAAGYFHSLALAKDGTVRGWGYNNYGQLGVDTVGATQPQAIPGLNDVVAIGAGHFNSFAVKKDGSVWTWGSSDAGLTRTSTPVKLPVENVTALAVGLTHVLALKNDGSVVAWGSNDYGQLGDGSTSKSDTPVVVAGLSEVIAIAAGLRHSVALTRDGNVWTWGKTSEDSTTDKGKCTFTIPGADGKPYSYDEPCAKRPAQVRSADGYSTLALGSHQRAGNATDRLFDYLEAAYPQYLPVHAPSQMIGDYYARAYLSGSAYIGAYNGRLHYLGPASSGKLLDLGTLTDWLSVAGRYGF